MSYKIFRRAQTYFIRVYIPQHLQLMHLTKSGRPKTEIVKTLRTRNLREAKRRAPLEFVNITREIHRLPDPQGTSGVWKVIDQYGRPFELPADPQDATQMAEVIEEIYGHETARRWFDDASGKLTTSNASEVYAGERRLRGGIKEGSLAKQTGHQKVFFDWLNKPSSSLLDISRTDAADFVAYLLKVGKSSSTVNDYISSMNNLWRTVRRRHENDLNMIWEDQGVEVRRTNAKRAMRSEEALRLASGLEGVLYDLWLTMLFTGVRIEEACTWRVMDVVKNDDGILGFASTVGKKDEEVGKLFVPLTDPEVVGIIEARSEGKIATDYIFDDITPSEGKARSSNVDKRLNRRIKKILDGEAKVSAHSCRKTHSTAGERAGLLPHEMDRLQNRSTGSLNMDVYSAGPTVMKFVEMQRLVSEFIRVNWLSL